jgi:hypothetical protein
MRQILGSLILVALLGCGDRPVPAVTCAGCGDGAVTCDGPLRDCIGETECETHGPGALILRADGTYVQTYSDGSTGSGTYRIQDESILFTNGALIPIYTNTCPW